MFEAGGYIAFALLILELVLLIYLIREKINKGVFLTATLPVAFFAAFFWIGNRITEITIPGVGTITAAATLANQYIEEIKNIKTDVDHQKQAIDLVATAARATDWVITELTEKNAKASEQLRQVADQLATAQQLTLEIQQKQEYAHVSRYGMAGLTGIAEGSAGLIETTPLSKIFGKYVHAVPNTELTFDCTPEALKAYTDTINFENKFPFPYIYRAACNRINRSGDWQHDIETARRILLITTQIPGHNPHHDQMLKNLDKYTGK